MDPSLDVFGCELYICQFVMALSTTISSGLLIAISHELLFIGAQEICSFIVLWNKEYTTDGKHHCNGPFEDVKPVLVIIFPDPNI